MTDTSQKKTPLDILMGGRDVTITTSGGDSRTVRVKQLPIRLLGSYRSVEGECVSLLLLCVEDMTEEQIDGLSHESIITLLDTAKELNSPLARRLELEEAAATARQMELIREYQPEVYEIATRQISEKMTEAVAGMLSSVRVPEPPASAD